MAKPWLGLGAAAGWAALAAGGGRCPASTRRCLNFTAVRPAPDPRLMRRHHPGGDYCTTRELSAITNRYRFREASCSTTWRSAARSGCRGGSLAAIASRTPPAASRASVRPLRGSTRRHHPSMRRGSVKSLPRSTTFCQVDPVRRLGSAFFLRRALSSLTDALGRFRLYFGVSAFAACRSSLNRECQTPKTSLCLSSVRRDSRVVSHWRTCRYGEVGDDGDHGTRQHSRGGRRC